MGKKLHLFIPAILIIFLVVNVSYSASKGKISGTVTDGNTKNPLPGVSVTVIGTNEIVFTDENGVFNVELPEGTYEIWAEFLGYNPEVAKNVVVTEEKKNIVNLVLNEIAAMSGEEFIVTGQRVNVPLSRATASVEVLSSKKFRDMAGADDAAAILKNVPGLQMESVGGAGTGKIAKIRGQGSSVDSNRILLLIDGVPVQGVRTGGADISRYPVDNIEKIEVMKGAASAIYGGNAQAGVINIITKKGTKKPVFKFNTGFSTFQHRTNANVDWTQSYKIFHSWGGDKFDYTISGEYLFSKGITYAETGKIAAFAANEKYIKVNFPGFPAFDPKAKAQAPPFLNRGVNELVDTGGLDDTENYNISASFGFKPFKGNYLRVNSGYSFRHSPNFFGVGSVPTIILSTANKSEYLNITDTWDMTQDIKYMMKFGMLKETDAADLFFFSSDFESKRNAGYYKRTGKDPGQDIGRYLGTGLPYNISPFHHFNKSWNIENSVTFTSDIFEPDGNSLTLGQFFRWEKLATPPSVNAGSQVLWRDPARRKDTALFFQVLQKFGKLNVNVGGRWEQITSFIDDFSDEFSPRFAVNYEISPGTTLRASIGRAFKPAQYEHLYYSGGQGGRVWGNPELTYDIFWNYEAGLKFLTKYVSGDIAYFYSKISDQDLEVPLLAANTKYIDYSNPRNVKFVKVYQKNREILGEELASSIDKVVDYYIEKGFRTKEEFIQEAQRARTWVNQGSSVYQGFDTSLDISNPWLPEFALNMSYVFNRAVAGNKNPFDFSQGTKPTAILGPNSTGGKRSPVPIIVVERPGEQLLEVPVHTFRMSGSYKFPIGLIATINGRFKSTSQFKSSYSATGFFKQPEHWVWDVALIQPLYNDRMTLKFAIENVFSKLYYEVGSIPSNVARYELGLSWKF